MGEVGQPTEIGPTCDQVFFDITINDVAAGRIVMELYDVPAPITAENFERLATCTNVTVPCFKDTFFHRIIPGFMMQGGDTTAGNGTGGMSIYGEKFADENFLLRFVDSGVLAMANSGPNTNGSQFFITFKSTPWLDGKHVVFGHVIDGFEVMDAIEAVGSNAGTPAAYVKIVDAGLLMEDQVCETLKFGRLDSNLLAVHEQEATLSDFDSFNEGVFDEGFADAPYQIEDDMSSIW
mmetsp:Transcript_21162/g.36339  ORF Transcript_21162/g.36339 Transcript_21162/m.36339 type:complete len:236 (+) Transcript_21162:113-820(+)|eukprot:CAMPEP_0196657100 /NCGR_PEP_ID=MMETSP1086-20130531/21809_1 /TAXON_ID=77921 /ORGANISM="Cyanoptyche  gloeocystis , Strain SAG4.97" /LENGTH=235 /DNA_ID=CAMNT_0041990121 /DNA_START=111 /DNA_END=818 /DNA_ORIENTATION=+